MFVKVYRYHIRADKIKEFLDLQERAGKIYKKHISYHAVYIRSRNDPALWLEIQWCRDEDTYRSAMDLINAEPGIRQLWQEFQLLLDPANKDILEEEFEQILTDGTF